jgi:hypothetical protein
MHDVDPRSARKRGLATSERIFILGIVLFLVLMAGLYKSYRNLNIKMARQAAASSENPVKILSKRSGGGGIRREQTPKPLIDVSSVHGGLHSDGYFRYSGTVRNTGNTSAENLVLSVELFDTNSSKLVGRDTQIYPELPPLTPRNVRGSMSVPCSTTKVRMEVDVENYPTNRRNGQATSKNAARP